MRILVCGSRNPLDLERCFAINAILATHLSGEDTLIHGGATGVDAFVEEAARTWKRVRQVLRFRAEWDKYGPAAGPIRNQRMVDDGKPDLVIAFPGGRGTADMKRRACAAGIPVVEPLK